MQLNMHPAIGLGEMLPGWFAVPQNPVQAAHGVTYTPGIGEIIGGTFAVPQNPVKDYTAGSVRALGTAPDCGCGCGGSSGGCGGGKINGIGMGALSDDWAKIQSDVSGGGYMAVFQDTVMGVPVWAIGAGLLLLMFAGGEKHSYAGRGRRAARAAAGAW